MSTAIVTGGTRGIGAAISQGLKDAGHSVVAIYGGNTESAKAFEERTGIATLQCDVGDADACKAAAAQIQEQHGAAGILVNNAGITRDGMFHKMDLKSWQDVIQVNLNSAYNMTHAVIEGMRGAGWGRVVNISSINGQKGQMGQANYSAAKAGLLGFTRALAQETARKGITVNAIAPGYIDTEMVAAVPQDARDAILAQIPVGRFGKPEEIAAAVVFLTGEHSGFITGSTLTINGGQYLAA
jgi:acetoacetyl-CoA reductase